MNSIKKPKLIVILGPTSCGKTKLAVKLAHFFNGEIVSADSRQVYQGMDIGTGKDLHDYIIQSLPDKHTANNKPQTTNHKQTIPYHLIGIVNPKTQFSLAKYQKLAYQAIDDINKHGKIPFLVGGTGLYLQSIVDGYQLTDVKPDKKLREHLNMRTLEQLQKLAQHYKIRLNQSDFNNKRRLIRAIEKYRVQETKNKKQETRYDCLILGVKYTRAVINQHIDTRLIHRLEKEGMIDEIKKLHQNGVSWKRLDEFGLEYRFIAKYLKGELIYDEMVKQLATAIHQFAKRQLTWFKRMDRISWVQSRTQAKKLIKKFLRP